VRSRDGCIRYRCPGHAGLIVAFLDERLRVTRTTEIDAIATRKRAANKAQGGAEAQYVVANFVSPSLFSATAAAILPTRAEHPGRRSARPKPETRNTGHGHCHCSLQTAGANQQPAGPGLGPGASFCAAGLVLSAHHNPTNSTCPSSFHVRRDIRDPGWLGLGCAGSKAPRWARGGSRAISSSHALLPGARLLLGIVSGNTCVHSMRWPKLGAELWLKRCYSARAGASKYSTSSISFKPFKTSVALPYPRQIRVSPHTHVHLFLCKFSGSYSLFFSSVCPGCAKSLNYRNLARAKEVLLF
jgi:hypothetical protein